MVFAALNVLVMKMSVVGPLTDIAQATDRIADGNLDCEIPHYFRADEIGRLALAVENFRNAVRRNVELERLEVGTAKQRDAAIGERDKFSDKFLAVKWQLSGAINSMPQGIVMLDATG